MNHHLSPELDPATLRKRRQRSQSSPEHAGQSYSNYPPPDYPYPGSIDHSPSGSSLHQHLEGGGSGTESTVTVRRREANRLAAQRFRSRKKGYQDSLEDRIRVLEEEKDELLRRLGEAPENPNAMPIAGPTIGPGGIGHDEQDSETRFAALESANRRMRDEVRGVYEENERLREELEGWRRWHHERPRAIPSMDLNLPPLKPPLERTRSFTAPASVDNILPPLRLAPFSPAISDARSSLITSAPHQPPPFPPPSPRSLLPPLAPRETSPVQPLKTLIEQ